MSPSLKPCVVLLHTQPTKRVDVINQNVFPFPFHVFGLPKL